MNLIPLLIGVAIGTLISYIVFFLLNKTKNVSKSIYDELIEKFNETNTALKIEEDRFKNQQEELLKVESILQKKEIELTDFQTKSSSLETKLENFEQKNTELFTSLSTNIKLNETLRVESGSLAQKLAEELAEKRYLSESLNAKNELIGSYSEQINTQQEKLNILSTAKSSLDAQNSSLTETATTQKETIEKHIEQIVRQAEKINILVAEESRLAAQNSSLSDIVESQKDVSIHNTEIIDNQTIRINDLIGENSTLSAQKDSLYESHKEQKDIIQKQIVQLELQNEKINRLTSLNSTLTANNSSLNEKLISQKEEMIDIQKTAHLQFEKIASQILEEKSEKFTDSNKLNIEALLKPLGENIDSFKKKVEETYEKESKQRFSLEDKVKELIEQTNKVSSEANNLATALKGQAKKQGNWGEIILESILQKSGLVKDREYFLQQTIKDEDGKNLRPDVLVKLPDNRIIIIDSKVSLVAYDRFSASEIIEEQTFNLKEHIKSIYSHIDDLHGKKYDNLEAALDFTMMFIPIEPAYLLAIQSDQELWSYAYSKRILLISPTNLIACLKLMADLWKREMQSKNALEIVKRGELLYEKIVNFVTTLEDMGKHIGKTQQSYSIAINQLNSGSGNLIGQALKLKSLGLKSSKEISANMLPIDVEVEEVIEPKLLDENNNDILRN